jgi:hypothetical protein
VQYEDLQRHWYQGWGFHSTRITESFDLEAMKAALPNNAIPLLVIDGDNQVSLIEAGKPLKADPRQRVLWYGCKQHCQQDTPEPQASTSLSSSGEASESAAMLQKQ